MMERIWPTFLAALAAREQPGTTLLALQGPFRQEVGARLFMVMTFDPLTGQSQRVHSSHPNEYPVTGSQTLAPRLVVAHRCRGTQDVRRQYDRSDRRVFPDHELIRSLGCESVANLPVAFADAIIGTVNLLDVSGHYAPDRIARIESLSPLAAAALLAARLAGTGRAAVKDVRQ